jgi:hypothetical protein
MQHNPFTASRRSFMSAVMAGTGSLALWPRCLQAGGNGLRRLSFIVVTEDPAILPEDQTDLDSLFGDLNGSLQEDLLTV